MIKPIPKKLLPHNCIYKHYLGNTGESDEWEKETPLNHVKIEEKTQFKVTSNGREIVGNARMFYDLVNSEGLFEVPIQNDIIKFNNKIYIVFDIDVLCATEEKPHHYEIILK